MPKTTKKLAFSSSKRKQPSGHITCDPRPVIRRPSTWLIAALSLAFIITSAIAFCGVRLASYYSDIDRAKLSVFNVLSKDFIKNTDIVEGKDALYDITGYGISDEDGVFYITFNFTPYTVEYDADGTPKVDYEAVRYGIAYLREDKDRGGYSVAFSYPATPDDHPAGKYELAK